MIELLAPGEDMEAHERGGQLQSFYLSADEHAWRVEVMLFPASPTTASAGANKGSRSEGRIALRPNSGVCQRPKSVDVVDGPRPSIGINDGSGILWGQWIQRRRGSDGKHVLTDTAPRNMTSWAPQNSLRPLDFVNKFQWPISAGKHHRHFTSQAITVITTDYLLGCFSQGTLRSWDR